MFKCIFFSVLVLSSLFMGYGVLYDGWFKFIPSTLAIITMTYFFYPNKWKEFLGISWSAKEVFIGIAVFLAFLFTSFFVVKFSLPEGFHLKISAPIEYIVVPFQTINEELVFRGLLLSGLLSAGLKKRNVILYPALVFSILHWAFYTFNLVDSNRGGVDFSALLTLIFFAMAMNLLFIHTKSIILPWAIHFAWNVHQFGSRIVNLETGEAVKEFQVFNILVGSESVFFLSVGLFLVSMKFSNRLEQSTLPSN